MLFIMILMMTIHCFLMIQLYPVAFCSTVPCNYMWHFAVFISSSCILQYLCAPKLHFVVLQSLQFEVAFCSNVLNLSASFQRNVVPLQGRIQPLLKGGVQQNLTPFEDRRPEYAGRLRPALEGVRRCHPRKIFDIQMQNGGFWCILELKSHGK